MRHLIIPDIHNKWKIAENIIQEVPHDKIIFLGDYFDTHGDDEKPEFVATTAEWLKESIRKPNRTHLIGNHDMPYMFPNNEYLWCPGFTIGKNIIVSNRLSKPDWDLLRPYHVVKDYVFSHAGLSPDLFTHPIEGFSLERAKKMIDNDLENNAPANQYCVSFQWCPGRMGDCGVRDYKGGITWIDWDRLHVIDGINQVVGHSISDQPKMRDFDTDGRPNGYVNWCLDTWLGYYGILEEKENETTFTIHKVR